MIAQDRHPWLYILAGSCLAAGTAMPGHVLKAFASSFSTSTVFIGIVFISAMGAAAAAVLCLIPRIPQSVQQGAMLVAFLIFTGLIIKSEYNISEDSIWHNTAIVVSGITLAILWVWKAQAHHWPKVLKLIIATSLAIGLSPWVQAALNRSAEQNTATFSVDKLLPAVQRKNVLLLLLDETSPEYTDQITQPLRDQGLHLNSRIVSTAGRSTINAVPSMLTHTRHDDVSPCTAQTLCGNNPLTFSDLHAQNPNIDVLGFFLPYCRIQGLRSCYLARLDKNPEDTGYLSWLLYRLLNPSDKAPFIELREKIKEQIHKAPFWKQGGTLYVHLPLPHLPAQKQYPTQAQAYFDNITQAQALVAQMGQKMRTTFGNDFAMVILTDHAFRKPKHCTDQTTDPQDCNTYRGLPANQQRVKLTTATPGEMAHTLPNTNLGLLAAEF